MFKISVARHKRHNLSWSEILKSTGVRYIVHELGTVSLEKQEKTS